DVVRAYLEQLPAKMTRNAVGFIHHSNLGEFHGRPDIPDHGRARSVTGVKFKELAESAHLRCLSQEFINWGGEETIDVLSVFVRADSEWNLPYRSMRNGRFMIEADSQRQLAELYGKRVLQRSAGQQHGPERHSARLRALLRLVLAQPAQLWLRPDR